MPINASECVVMLAQSKSETQCPCMSAMWARSGFVSCTSYVSCLLYFALWCFKLEDVRDTSCHACLLFVHFQMLCVFSSSVFKNLFIQSLFCVCPYHCLNPAIAEHPKIFQALYTFFVYLESNICNDYCFLQLDIEVTWYQECLFFPKSLFWPRDARSYCSFRATILCNYLGQFFNLCTYLQGFHLMVNFILCTCSTIIISLISLVFILWLNLMNKPDGICVWSFEMWCYWIVTKKKQLKWQINKWTRSGSLSRVKKAS